LAEKRLLATISGDDSFEAQATFGILSGSPSARRTATQADQAAMSLAPGSLLAQIRPVNTTAAAGFTAIIQTEILRVVIANTTGSAATFRLFHDVGGSSYSEANALAWDISIATGAIFDNQAYGSGSGFTLLPGDTIGVRSSVNSALTFNLYGVVASSR
jgi:hypothetical protein